MTSITFEELMKRAIDFEHRVEEHYTEISDKTEDVGVKLLAFYLSHHRRHLEQALSGLGQDQRNHIGTVRLKFDIPFEAQQAFKRLAAAPELIKSGELLAGAVGYDTQLVGLYKAILAQPVGPEAGSFAESLIKLEEKDIVMLKKIEAMDYF